VAHLLLLNTLWLLVVAVLVVKAVKHLAVVVLVVC
jgi:hypothetical protein